MQREDVMTMDASPPPRVKPRGPRRRTRLTTWPRESELNPRTAKPPYAGHTHVPDLVRSGVHAPGAVVARQRARPSEAGRAAWHPLRIGIAGQHQQRGIIVTAPIDPRAQAKADKAYRKATRPWWRKKRFWLLGGVVLVVIIAIASNSGGDVAPPAEPSSAAQETADATDPS